MLIKAIRNIMALRIMILDDEKLIRWSLDQILAQDGYEVDTAATTGEALALADEAEYALILTDLEVCGDRAKPFLEDMIAKQPHARIVMLTALGRDEAERMLGGVATTAIIEKPFTSEAIRTVVHGAIGRTRTTPDSSIKEKNG
jgi:DNA-binding response OmpR family regulator